MGRDIALGRERTGLLRAVSRALVASACVAVCACGAAATSDRYPERKRPEAPRSASDDEVLGASRQDPADTLEGSLTTGHAAPRSPHAEEHAEAAHERLEYEQCLERQNESAAAARGAAGSDTAPSPGVAASPGAAPRPGEARRRPVCSPPPEHEH